MKQPLQLLVCVIMGTLAFVVEPRHLLDLRTEVLTFLSILLGAVLFRLGRGLPPLAVERLEVRQIKRVADAFKEVARRLMWVFAATGITVLFLIAAEPLMALAHGSPMLQRIVAFIASSLSAFAVVRAVVVVLGDRDLVNLQADLIVRDAQKRHARETSAKLDKAEEERPFTTSEDYGGLSRAAGVGNAAADK